MRSPEPSPDAHCLSELLKESEFGALTKGRGCRCDTFAPPAGQAFRTMLRPFADATSRRAVAASGMPSEPPPEEADPQRRSDENACSEPDSTGESDRTTHTEQRRPCVPTRRTRQMIGSTPTDGGRVRTACVVRSGAT